MMKLFAVLFIAALLVQWLLPWWSFVPVCVLGGYLLARSGGQAFGAGFLAIGLGWTGVASVLWLLTHSLLPGRVATLLGLPSGALLAVLTGVLSGLLGGIATVTGWWLRRAFDAGKKTQQPAASEETAGRTMPEMS
jgi:hypothetical protein